MKQDGFVWFVISDLYHMQVKLDDIGRILSDPDLDDFFDKVPNGVKTRNEMISDFSQAGDSINRAHLAWLSARKRKREVDNVSP